MIKVKHNTSFVAIILILAFIISICIQNVSASTLSKSETKSYFDKNKTKIKSIIITRKNNNNLVSKEIINLNLKGSYTSKVVSRYFKNKLKDVTKYGYKNKKFIKLKKTYYYNIHKKFKTTQNKAYASYNYKNKKKTYLTKTAKRNQVVALTKKLVGKRYVAGGKTPRGFDCSGLTSYVYKKAVNKKLGRSSSAQTRNGKYINKISLKTLKPGDVLFWGTKTKAYHVGIYVGNGQYIHAETPKAGVKKRSLLKSGFTPNYAKRMI